MEYYGNAPVMVMEDFAGEPLTHFLNSQQHLLNELLEIAGRTVDLLGQVHSHGIIHKDINPANIVWNPGTDQLKIIDFGMATQLSRENLAIRNPERIEGTLAYISPEQTGRMNRALDYRTDFYSLGVMFYKMFTGKMPFETTDALELVHCHIAKMPVPLYEIDPRIPISLSRIVMKLLAKAAEDRYQSIHGLKSDLEECLNRLRKGNKDVFKIGRYDIPEKFRIPEKIYGREKEIAALLDVFHRATFGQEKMILFSGSPGIGKSVLIHEIHKPIIEKRGIFCKGKYDQYKKNIPYSAVIQAFRELLRQVLSESEERLAVLKTEMLEALGAGGQVIIDVIGEVELIIGKQPEVRELPPQEAQNRFNMLFQNFVKVFSKKEHPLVLFLDDLQWADNSSLELTRTLLEDPELEYFLFVGAYRDNETDQGHPLMLMLEKLEKAGFSWRDIHVGPLNKDQVGQLVADTLYSDIEKTKDLSKLLIQKTGGNPFFLKAFMKTLDEQGFFEYKHGLIEESGWTWDVSKIRQARITDNVVELMAEKVKKLPENTWNVLKIACCMGSHVYLTPLASACGKSEENALDELKEAIDEGILILVEDNLKFVHDRVWEAAYSLINDKERKELHYAIGKEMLGQEDEDQVEDSIFNIANQWNQAKDLLDENERRQLLDINFKAGQKAISSAAYAAAVNLFRHGAELLSKNSWESEYKFTLSFHTQWSEAEYLARNVKEAERLFDIVLLNAHELMEKINIYSIQIDLYHTQVQYEKSLEVGIKALKELGIRIPKKPGKPAILIQLIKAKILSRKKNMEKLIQQAEITDEKKIAAMEIMVKCIPSSLAANPNLTPILSVKMASLTFKYGNSPKAAFGYVMYGLILSGPLGEISNGYDFGQLAVKMADKSESDITKLRTYIAYGCTLLHLKNHHKDAQVYFEKSRELGLASGDFLYLGHAYFNMSYILLFSGESLDSINANIFQKYSKTVNKLNQPHITDYFNLWHQGIRNLMGESDDYLLLKGHAFDEEVTIPRFRETNDEPGLGQYFVIKQYLTYLSRDFPEGITFSREAEKYYNALLGVPTVQISYFLHALLLSAHYQGAADKDKKKYLKKLKSIQKKFREWGEHNPHNYLHKYFLISAEINRITHKNMVRTVRLYSDAIRLANENEVVYEEAVARELAAEYYLSLGQEEIAAVYMNEAYYCYMRWGAKPKIKELENKYPRWITITDKERQPAGDKSITSTTSTDSLKNLDLGTIIKASNTIAREIKLGELLEKMMHIVIENAGAQKGYFLLSKNGKWFVEAQGDMDRKDVDILQSIPVDTINGISCDHPTPTPSSTSSSTPSSFPGIAKSIVKYVERTKDTVVLSDAAHEGNFTEDDYIKLRKPKSVLCFPLLNQGELAGILYLENNLTTGAFTPDRLGVLNTISSQIAISIENARMYEELDELNKNLEQKVADRTQELSEKNEQILSSIRYSERIQAAAMPREETIKAALQDHFILFLPRDIVSGDFYWFTETEEFIFLAVVDCTGHGVPGALLAMMGDVFLKEIIVSRLVADPGKILEELHKKVRTHLRQAEKGVKSLDGMDVCLCRIGKENRKLIFAGAKRPLYVVTGDETAGEGNRHRLIEIRGDRKSIGGRQKEINRTYTSHEIEARKGDMIYLTSDGFADQPDRRKLKRYGSRRLKIFLESLPRFPVEEQKKHLLDELHSYQDSEKQRDDITVVGFRI
jgi:predicted ATPase/GAF domain-containing protein